MTCNTISIFRNHRNTHYFPTDSADTDVGK